jgi:YD repeat-containing protein
MKERILIIFMVILGISIGACKHEVRLMPYQDPFFDALRKKNVCQVISFSRKAPALSDTIYLERNGYTLKFSGYALEDRLTYDSLLFIRSKYEGPDVYDNFIIDYHFNSQGNLIQRWRQTEINDSTKIIDKPSSTKIVVFVINSQGNIAREIDSVKNEYTSSIYDTKGLLIERSHFSINPDRPKDKWKYEYNGEGQLKTINQTAGETLILTHYFTNGLLDSTVNHLKGYQVVHLLAQCKNTKGRQ